MDSVYIYMDIYRCGKIARVAIDSFVNSYPDTPVHVYGVESDFDWLRDLAKLGDVRFVDISDDHLMQKRWDVHGHWGTAHLWAKLINTRPEKYLLHLDSDIIFRGKALDPIFQKLAEGYDLVGPHRNYKYNKNNRDDVRHLPDVVQTCIFAFNRELVTKRNFEDLVLMCRGSYNPKGHPVIDFFDPVSFEIISNGGKVEYLSVEDYGGTHYTSERDNSFGILNHVMGDFGKLFVHFSTVGSGLKYKTDFASRVLTSKAYVRHGYSRYWFFCWLFYGQDLDLYIENRSLCLEVSGRDQELIYKGLNLKRILEGIPFEQLEKSLELSSVEKIKSLITLSHELSKKILNKVRKTVRARLLQKYS